MASQIQENIASIAKSRDDFQAVFSGSTEGLVFFDSDMMVLAYNDAAAKFFDVPVDSAVGYPLIQSVRNADIQALVYIKAYIFKTWDTVRQLLFNYCKPNDPAVYFVGLDAFDKIFLPVSALLCLPPW